MEVVIIDTIHTANIMHNEESLAAMTLRALCCVQERAMKKSGKYIVNKNTKDCKNDFELSRLEMFQNRGNG